MPGLHLPRAPYDKLLGHRRRLRATMFVFTLSTSIVSFLVLALGGRPGQIRTEAALEIVRKSYNFNAVAVQSPQPPHGNHTDPVQLPCKGYAEKAWSPCSRRAVFKRFFAPMFTEKSCVCCTISASPPRDTRAGIVQWYLRHVHRLRAYDFFQICITFCETKS